MALKLMFATNNPQVALIAQAYGVDRIWVDLETLGKEERQGHMDSLKSHHSVADIAQIAPLLDRSEMFVRINPIHEGSKEEIDAVIAAGAGIIMLPMWKSASDVKTFLDSVDGRVKTSLLLETREAAECVDEVLAMGGFDEIHVGINDLHLSYHLDFMFEVLTNGMVDTLCEKFQKHRIPYGFGGIARVGSGMIPAEMLIMEHYRLGSTRAILSRSFCNTELPIGEIETLFATGMEALRSFEAHAGEMNREAFEENRKLLKSKVEEIVLKRKSNG